MPHPQDVAVPSLPEPLTWRWTNSETGGHGFHPIKGHGNPRFAHIYTWDAVFAADQMNTRWLEGYKAGRAAGRASAEPEGVTEREKTVIGLDYDGTITRDPDMWFAVMKLMQDFGHEVHIVTMRHGVESLMGGSPMERRFLEGANGVHFTGNSATGDRDAKRPHMDAKGIEVHVWIDDNPKAVHMSAREIWGWCTQPGDTMIHSAPEIHTPTASAEVTPADADELVPTRGTTAIVNAWNDLPADLRLSPHLCKLFEAVKTCRDVSTPTASIAPKAEGRDFPMLRFPELYGVPPKADPLSASVESRLAECASKPFESEGNRRVVPKAEGEAAIDMVLHCPACGMQHIDAPESMAPKDQPQLNAEWGAWANPPHRSHLCHGCGHVWRPADVPTNGVAAVKTTGKADSPIAAAVAQAAAGANRAPGSEENRPVIPRSKCALYGGSCNCDPDTVYCPVHNRIAIIAPLETPTVSDRSRFEAHMRPFGYSLARDGAGDYADPEVRGSWSIWRAALSPRPEADADRASGGGVDTERLNWLLANPNTVLEDAGNEWFILDADSEPTYFKSGREAIDAARATPTTKD